MTRHIAFLRGINVGGQKIIKMEDLNAMFAGFGLKNVKTYIQSGNVLFDAPEKDPAKLARTIEKGLLTELRYAVPVVVRTTSEIEAIIKLDPFKKEKSDDSKKYVTFLSGEPTKKPKLPLLTSKKEIRILSVHALNAFSLGLPLPGGRFGFPNNIIEKELGVAGTTRNWTTVNKIIL